MFFIRIDLRDRFHKAFVRIRFLCFVSIRIAFLVQIRDFLFQKGSFLIQIRGFLIQKGSFLIQIRGFLTQKGSFLIQIRGFLIHNGAIKIINIQLRYFFY